MLAISFNPFVCVTGLGIALTLARPQPNSVGPETTPAQVTPTTMDGQCVIHYACEITFADIADGWRVGVTLVWLFHLFLILSRFSVSSYRTHQIGYKPMTAAPGVCPGAVSLVF